MWALSFVACASPAPRPLDELVVADSVYLDPGTDMPFTGSVVRTFSDDPGRVELEGRLGDGVWDGELVVYHPNGRVRYMGSFRAGVRCGPWTENADSTATGSVYEALIREVETIGLYEPCDADEQEESMEIWEIAILAAITIGFFWLIMYAAQYARSKKEDE